MSLVTFVTVGLILAQQAAVPRDAAISGLVLEAETNTPLPGAEVTLIWFGPRPQPGRPPQTLMATTDRTGRYEFEALEPGRYSVAVRKTGFVPAFGPGLPEVTLNPSERKMDLDVTIQRGAAMVGRVLDQNGAPLASVSVLLWRRPSLANGATESARSGKPVGPIAQTNDLGEFRFFDLVPGDVYVQATSPRDLGRYAAPQPRVRLATYYPSTPDAAAATPITLIAGLTARDVLITMLSAAAFEVSGIVTDEAGRAFENALIQLESDGPPGQPMPSMDRALLARTDKAGKFRIAGVVSGSYRLLAITSVPLSSRVAGDAVGVVTTETVNGVTEYRNYSATSVSLTVNDASIVDLVIVAGKSK